MKSKYILNFILLFFPLLFCSSTCYSEDLLAVFHLAECNDAVIQSAKQTQLAAREAIPQARALFMPVISANSSHMATDTQYAAGGAIDSFQRFPPDVHYNASIYTLSLTQPVFYYQQWVQMAKACEQVKEANATYAAAEQDLIVRTATAYFNVLKAYDALKFAKAAQASYENFLNQTQERYNVGLITITDVQIAKAQRDNAKATVIFSENDLQTKKEILRVITGKKIENFSFLRENIKFKPPEPTDMEAWVEQAVEQNYTLLAAQYAVEVSKTNVKLNSANNMPTVAINSSIAQSTSTPFYPRNINRLLGLQVQLPIFNGGATVSKTRQAAHVYGQTLEDMEETYRVTQSNTRQAYLGVLTQISQIEAYKQGIASNQSALEATNGAFSIGTRTIVDVLTAQSNLIQAQQNYAFSRYDYILESIRLKQAAGSLNPQDICHINALLKD